MRKHMAFCVVLFVLAWVQGARAEVYMTTENCRIKTSTLSLKTYLHSVVEDGISEHKYRSTLALKGGKPMLLSPESEVDATPMSLGSSYTLVSKGKGPPRKFILSLKHAVEKSSFSNINIACGPVLSVKEYDVKLSGVGLKPIRAKMVCDSKSVFQSSKCYEGNETAKR